MNTQLTKDFLNPDTKLIECSSNITFTPEQTKGKYVHVIYSDDFVSIDYAYKCKYIGYLFTDDKLQTYDINDYIWYRRQTNILIPDVKERAEEVKRKRESARSRNQLKKDKEEQYNISYRDFLYNNKGGYHHKIYTNDFVTYSTDVWESSLFDFAGAIVSTEADINKIPLQEMFWQKIIHSQVSKNEYTTINPLWWKKRLAKHPELISKIDGELAKRLAENKSYLKEQQKENSNEYAVVDVEAKLHVAPVLSLNDLLDIVASQGLNTLTSEQITLLDSYSKQIV